MCWAEAVQTPAEQGRQEEGRSLIWTCRIERNPPDGSGHYQVCRLPRCQAALEDPRGGNSSVQETAGCCLGKREGWEFGLSPASQSKGCEGCTQCPQPGKSRGLAVQHQAPAVTTCRGLICRKNEDFLLVLPLIPSSSPQTIKFLGGLTELKVPPKYPSQVSQAD